MPLRNNYLKKCHHKNIFQYNFLMKKMKKIKLIPALKKHFSYFFLKKKNWRNKQVRKTARKWRNFHFTFSFLLFVSIWETIFLFFAPEMMMKILMWCKYIQFKFHSEESQRVCLSVRLAFKKKKITKERERQIRVQVRCRYF